MLTAIYSISVKSRHTHTYNHFTALWILSGITRVSRYQKGKTSLDFTEARDSEWQWYQLGHIQICTSPRQITMPQRVYKFDRTNFQEISRRFQEGFQEKSRTCLHCFGLLCNVPNLLHLMKHVMMSSNQCSSLCYSTNYNISYIFKYCIAQCIMTHHHY